MSGGEYPNDWKNSDAVNSWYFAVVISMKSAKYQKISVHTIVCDVGR